MKISGVGSALPSKVIANDELASFLDTSDEWIKNRTGISQRRLITTETLYDLSQKAIADALKAADKDINDIDFLICSNVANNYVTPGMGCILQGLIGAKCACLDINSACAGFIYALSIADSMMKVGRAHNILIICAEEPSKFCNWANRDTTVLFGDGAAAVVLTEGDSLKSIKLTTTSMPDVLYYRRKLENTPFDEGTEKYDPLVMQGKEVFRMAVSNSVKDIKSVIQAAGLNTDSIDYFVLHQANLRIIDSIRTFLEQEKEKFPVNLNKYGNTSSASIPILLNELINEEKIKKGNKIVLSAFGAGFISGACVLQWE